MAVETWCWIAPNGKEVSLRPIGPGDEGRVADYLARLSFSSRYFRFGRGDITLTPEQLTAICNQDPAEGRRFAILTKDGNDDEIQIASAGLVILPDRRSCEIALLVADAWQGYGLAHRLLERLVLQAAEYGLEKIIIEVLGTNRRMLDFARGHGFEQADDCTHAPIKRLCLRLDHPE